MKRCAVERWGLLVAASLLASQAAFAQTYKFKVVASAKEYGGGTYQPGDLNNKGQFSFNIVGSEKDSGDAGETGYFFDGSAIIRFQPTAAKLSDGSNLVSASMWTPHNINDAGKVAYVADTDKSPHAIVVWNSADKSYQLVATNTTVVDGGKINDGGVALQGRMLADINNKDQVAWSQGLIVEGSDPNDAVFMYDPASNKITTVARRGTAVPGGKTLLNALFPNINDAGEVVFMANTTDNENFGIYAWQGGNITVVCAPGTKVGNVTIASAQLPRNSDGGHIVFRGEVTASGGAAPVADDTGFFIYSAGKLEKIVVPGDALPGGKFVATEGNRRAVGVNKNGQVAFKATMENEATGIFLWQAGKITPVITSGQSLEAAGKVDSVVQGVGDNSGYHMAINDLGDIVFSGTVDGSYAFVLATAPR